jgi:DNA-binding NarL/FixJ family response regulator
MSASSGASGIAPTRIIVVDDHPLVRESLVQLITREPDLAVCAEADSVETAAREIERHKPDLVLLDLRLKSGDSLELVKSVRARFPATRVLIISQQEETLFAERCLRAGADGYVTKQEVSEEVLTAIRTVLDGETYVSRKVAVLVFRRTIPREPVEKTKDISRLTDRELHVFQQIGAGMSCAAIAAEMKLSVKTVETHRENIKNKLGITGSKLLADFAREWLSGR